MKLNLDALKPEIQDYLESRGLVVFHGYARAVETVPAVYWDCERFPDYHAFIDAAQKAGARLVTIYSREFTEEMIEDALDRLESSDMNRDDRRGYEVRLREMQPYAGFTATLELSFDLAARVYLFDLRTDWYNEFCEMLDDIDAAYPEESEGDDEGKFGGGYFSKN